MINSNRRERHCPNDNAAFSLIELSIVLVIMGLLIAGVSAGSSLIKSAELRAVVAQSENFKVGAASYYAKKGRLPGDDPKPTADADENLKFGGNSNGVIELSSTRADGAKMMEGINAWKYLSEQQIINGTYEGIEQSAAPTALDDTNLPTAKKKGGVWLFDAIAEAVASRGSKSYVFLVNKLSTKSLTNGGTPATDTIAKQDKKGVLPSADAASMDDKYDDGLADKGTIRTFSNDNTGDACDYASSTASTDLCAVAFKLDI